MPELLLEQYKVAPGDTHPRGIYDGTWNIAGICANCTRKIPVGSGFERIDFTNSNENMIWALGPPGLNPHSNDYDAPLRRHTAYGHFTMDLGAASVTTNNDSALASVGLPPLGTADDDARIDGNVKNDHEPSSPAHAALMCFAFLIVFPLGVISSRVLEKVKLHAAIQGAGLAIVIIGMGIGIYMSKYYNRVCYKLFQLVSSTWY